MRFVSQADLEVEEIKPALVFFCWEDGVAETGWVDFFEGEICLLELGAKDSILLRIPISSG